MSRFIGKLYHFSDQFSTLYFATFVCKNRNQVVFALYHRQWCWEDIVTIWESETKYNISKWCVYKYIKNCFSWLKFFLDSCLKNAQISWVVIFHSFQSIAIYPVHHMKALKPACFMIYLINGNYIEHVTISCQQGGGGVWICTISV